jgi:hypothetical protein
VPEIAVDEGKIIGHQQGGGRVKQQVFAAIHRRPQNFAVAQANIGMAPLG